MEGKQIPSPFLLILSILLSLISIPSSTALTVELIPRHQLIPLSNITREAVLLRSLKRDSLRVVSFSNHVATATQSDSISAPVSSGFPLFYELEYFVHLGFGTPAKQLYLALDISSDIVWLQCRPCKSCYNQSDPIFEPENSTSFSPLYCDSQRCKQLGDYDLSNCSYYPKSSCKYGVWYGDNSFTVGNLSTETLTFGTARVDNVTIGCGHDNKGYQNPTGFAGILGLGRGSLSFPTQTGHKIFSYCLPSLLTYSVDPPSNSSSITFGDSEVYRKASFTPLLLNPNSQLYYVGLTGISVGGNLVSDIKPSYFEMDSNGTGGVIIDSRTTYTWLNQNVSKPLREAFRKAMNLTVITTSYTQFDTCYNLSGMENMKVPSVELHFDGVNMDLPKKNYMLHVDNGTYCFGFLEQEGDGYSIIGIMQQQGFGVTYDLENNQIGFTPDACPEPSG